MKCLAYLVVHLDHGAGQRVHLVGLAPHRMSRAELLEKNRSEEALHDLLQLLVFRVAKTSEECTVARIHKIMRRNLVAQRGVDTHPIAAMRTTDVKRELSLWRPSEF